MGARITVALMRNKSNRITASTNKNSAAPPVMIPVKYKRTMHTAVITLTIASAFFKLFTVFMSSFG